MIKKITKYVFKENVSKTELLKIGMLISLFFIPITFMTIEQQISKMFHNENTMIATCQIKSMIFEKNNKRDYICKMKQSDNSIMLNEQNVQYNGYEYKTEKFTQNGQILLYTSKSN